MMWGIFHLTKTLSPTARKLVAAHVSVMRSINMDYEINPEKEWGQVVGIGRELEAETSSYSAPFKCDTEATPIPMNTSRIPKKLESGGTSSSRSKANSEPATGSSKIIVLALAAGIYLRLRL